MGRRDAKLTITLIFACILAPACDKKDVADVPSPPASTEAPETVSSVLTPRAPPTPDLNDEARETVHAWNDALSRHDLHTLDALYADNVKLYGTAMTRQLAIAQKRAAFRHSPDFHQRLTDGPILLLDDAPGHLHAKFVKVSVYGTKETPYNSYLGLKRTDTKWIIDEESDETTDQNLDEKCSTAVMEEVSATAPGKNYFTDKLENEDALRDAGFQSRGGMVMPRNSSEKTITVALHSSFTDHIVNEMWFVVDPKTGAVTGGSMDANSKDKVVTDPALAKAVVAACANANAK